MKVVCLTPILNVSNMEESFAWFEKLGWKKLWDWGDPPSFGAVRNGEVEIFLCQDGQGSRGGPLPRHAGDDDTGGVWMSWFLASPAEVDAAHQLALDHGLTVTWPPRMNPGASASATSDILTAIRFAWAREPGKSEAWRNPQITQITQITRTNDKSRRIKVQFI